MVGLESSPVAERIEKATSLLDSVLSRSDSDLGAIGKQFECVTVHVGNVFQFVSAIVDCVDDERVQSILPQVQAMGNAAQHFIHERLKSTSEIADVVAAEAKLLEKLCQVTSAQLSVARQTTVLSVVTNIEVANLGKLGQGFGYLAHELHGFSEGVAKGTEEVASETEQRRVQIEETKKRLASALPRMQSDFSRIEADLGKALADMSRALSELSTHPLRFKDCVQAIAEQVSSVVAAVQSQDITRQQIEHVRDALKLIASEDEPEASDQREAASRRAAILKVQDYQLKNIEETTRGWVTQIGLCLGSIEQISSSEMVAIGSTILEHERLLSSQMASIAQLEQESQEDDAAMHESLAGLDALMQLVREHLEKSKLARDRMQLLNFNSLIEARHLGSKGAVMVEISQNIRRISGDWSEMTTRSGEAMEEIVNMVKRADDGLQAFSQDSKGTLREAQEATRTGLKSLQSVAASATKNGTAVGQAVARLQGEITSIRRAAERLDTGLRQLKQALSEVEEVNQQMRSEVPEEQWCCDKRDLERSLSAPYTTEAERQVLRAALYGEEMPKVGQSLAGNDVELF